MNVQLLGGMVTVKTEQLATMCTGLSHVHVLMDFTEKRVQKVVISIHCDIQICQTDLKPALFDQITNM